MSSGRITSFLQTDSTRKAALFLAIALIGTAGCGGDLDSRLAEIRSLQEAGNFEASIEPLRGLVTTNSVHPQVNYLLGRALVQTGRQSLAIWPLQKAAGSDELALPAGLLLINALIHTGDYVEAVRAADRILSTDPDNWMALAGRAQANLVASNPEATLADAEHMLGLDPQDIGALVMRTGALADLGRLDEAEATQHELERVATATGNTVRAGRSCAARGVLFMKTDRPDEARETFASCIDTYPDSPVVRTQATDFFVAQGDFAAAAELWQTAVEADPEDATNRVRLADLLRQDGRTEEAEAVLQEMVELFDSSDAWRAMAIFYRSAGNPASAREALQQAIERASGNTEALRFELADLMIEDGNLDRARELAAQLAEPAYSLLLAGAISMAEEDYAGALQHFESGLRRWPNNANARHLAGIAAERLGDIPRARAEYREAVRNDATRTDAALRLGQLHFNQAEFVAASTWLSTHLDSRPFDGPEAHLLAARSAIRTGDYEEASRILQSLLRQRGHQIAALVELAHVTARAESPDQAVVALQAAAEAESEVANSPDIQRAIIKMLSEAGRSKEALELARIQLAADPGDTVLQDLMGRILLREGRLSEAKAAFTRAAETDPEAAEPHRGLGIVALAQGDRVAARRHFESGAELEPDSGEYVYRLGQILLAEGNQAEAIKTLKRSVEIEPSHLGANNDLAWLLAESGGDLELALELAQRAVRLSPVSATNDTLGWVHLKRGDGDLAEQAFARVLAADGETPSALYHVALAIAQQGRTEEAESLVRKALSGGSFPEREAAKAALASFQGP